MWSYKIVFVLVLATVKVNVLAKYFVSDDKTRWDNANCSLAEPQLAYMNASIYVKESISLPSEDVWIGYRQAKIPFLFIGFGHVSSEKIYTVTSIGYCFNACGSGPFGIQPVDDNAILFNSAPKQCRCGSNISMVANCGQQTGKETSKNNTACAAIFNSINAAEEEFPNVTSTEGDCMQYFFPLLVWANCTVPEKYPIKVMCSNKIYTDSTATADKVNNPSKYNWIDGNALCLINNMYPVSGKTIYRGGLITSDTQYFWTGIIRSTALINISTVGILDKSIYQVNQFAFVKGEKPDLQFTSNDNSKSALCSTQDTSTSTVSTVPAVGVGIGVAVGLLCAVGAVVVIIVLRKRGVFPRRLRSISETTNSGSLACTRTSYESCEVEIKNQNYFILEKCAQSVDESADHKNTADEPNEGNDETDNYHTIGETEEPYQSVKDEYDYTINTFRTGPNNRKPDNVYNKLKVDRPGDYDQVGRLEHKVTQAGSDYDTTAVSHRNDGDGDYNHIPHPDRTTFARGNVSKVLAKEDNDVINGKKIELSPSDASDYAHVNV